MQWGNPQYVIIITTLMLFEKLFGDLSIIGKLLVPTSVSAVYIPDAPEVCGIEYISR